SASTAASGTALELEARMPPTERCPLRLSRPRSSPPARNGWSRRSSARRKGTVLQERSATLRGVGYSALASIAAYSLRCLASLIRCIASSRPCSLSHWKISPDRYQAKVGGVLYMEPLAAATL